MLLLYSIDVIEHYDFCIMDPTRSCSENLRCLATDEDIDNAVNYAYKRVCEDNGYKYIQFEDGFDCVHTEETCLRDTRYPSTADEKYLEWNYDHKCVVAMEKFRDYCEAAGNLRYDDRGGTCHVTHDSCKSWGADFTGSDCDIPLGQKIGEATIGTTTVRSIKNNPANLAAMSPLGATLVASGALGDDISFSC